MAPGISCSCPKLLALLFHARTCERQSISIRSHRPVSSSRTIEGRSRCRTSSQRRQRAYIQASLRRVERRIDVSMHKALTGRYSFQSHYVSLITHPIVVEPGPLKNLLEISYSCSHPEHPCLPSSSAQYISSIRHVIHEALNLTSRLGQAYVIKGTASLLPNRLRTFVCSAQPCPGISIYWARKKGR